MGFQALEDKCCLSQYQLHIYIIYIYISEDTNYNGLTVVCKKNAYILLYIHLIYYLYR